MRGGRTNRRLAFGLLLAGAVAMLVIGVVQKDWERIHQFSSQI